MNIYCGDIITCNQKQPRVRYLVEKKGGIVYTGNDLPEEYLGYPVTHLSGKAMLPSFADTHLHFSSFAFFLSNLYIRKTSSIDDTLEQMSAYIKRSRRGMVLGFGVSAHNVVEKRLIRKSDIDSRFPGVPVMLIKYDGHASVCSSAMLEKLPARIASLRGYHADTGELNHEAFFAATEFITSKVSPIDLVSGMLRAYDTLAANGIGLIHPAEGVGFPRDLDVDLSRFVARGLKNRMQSRLFFQTLDERKVLTRKLPRIGGCFAAALDGCFGSLDAAVTEPYSGSTNSGILTYAQEEVNAFVRRLHRAGLQVSLHAIGNAAFHQAVTAFDCALRDFPREDHRHTIIHACLPDERDLDLAAKRALVLAVQPAFIGWDAEPDSYLESILGKRAASLNPLKSMTKKGILLTGGSDAPCTFPDPVHGIHSACNHSVPGESLSVQEAIDMYTVNAAKGSFDERKRGTLQPGKIADMVILDRDPLDMNPRELYRLQVVSTILSGKEYVPGQGLVSLVAGAITGRNKQ